MIRLVALLVSLAGSSYGSLTQEQLRADLQYVVKWLPSVHPNLFFSTPSTDFFAAAAQLDADIPGLSTEQFYTRLGALVAMINDSHTRLVLENSTAAALGFVRLPIEFQSLDDGLFVVSAPAAQAFLNGARLIRVGGLAAEDVVTRLQPEVAHTNVSGLRFGVASILSNGGVLRGIGAAPAEGPVSFGFQLGAGAPVTVQIAADNSGLTPALRASDGYLPPLADHAGDNYWSEYWALARTVYVRYAQCVEMPARSSSAFAADTLALIDRNPVDTIIVDLRADGGGSENVTLPLVTGILRRIGALRANPKFQIYTLIDGGTESAAMNTAVDLKYPVVPPTMTILGPAGSRGADTILAGEPTGGHPAYYGGGGQLILPQSHLSLRYSTGYTPPFAGIPVRDAIYPDLPVAPRSTDYFARHDPVVAAALAQALPPPAAPAGPAVVVNSASLRPETGIAAGSLASAFGSFSSGNVTLTVNGESAQLLAATAGQLNFVIPAGTLEGLATLEVRAGVDVISQGQFQVTPAGPGLFVTDEAARSQPGAILNQDYTLNTVATPAPRGAVAQIFATGSESADATAPLPVSVWIANRPAEVLYSGIAPGFPGLWQINVRIPDDPAIQQQVPVFIAADRYVSNGVTIFVGP